MSERSPQPLFRAARAVVFATVCVALAALGHVLAGGAAVPLWAGTMGFGAVVGVTLMLAGHERSLGTILGGLLGGQFALHTLFTGAAADPAAHPMPAMAGHTPAMHAAMTDAAAMPGATAAHGGNGLAMTLAHCVAALVAAWWLRRGERSVWTMARRVAAAADRPVRLLLALLTIEPAGPPRPAVPAPAPAAVPAVDRALRHQVVRRGPPFRSRALAHI
ncbi:hypothetical protein HUT06_41810 [Actinomadura sp. NAK00032]|uniref:hypothetical protein n=1 Tax=Actinomadura sp. NAK00032 TaxID=2742128 RepID=UPI001592A040|nr:hypothetical protein [Actinomadura sp. NAK00032]QKW39766.1 hypothetical protein HUT06_41810 [Actinomadura sp. NAK00032]